MTRLAIPGHTEDSTAYLLSDAGGTRAAFVGDTVMPGALGRSDFHVSDPLAFGPSLQLLDRTVGRETLLLPGHDYDDRYACTLGVEVTLQPLVAGVLNGTLDAFEFAAAKGTLEKDLVPTEYQTMACGARVDICAKTATVELPPTDLLRWVNADKNIVLVDVREIYESRLSQPLSLGRIGTHRAVPLSTIVNAIPDWMAAKEDTSLVLFCRSGNRSAKAAQALRRLGLTHSWSLAGGLALWPQPASQPQAAAA